MPHDLADRYIPVQSSGVISSSSSLARLMVRFFCRFLRHDRLEQIDDQRFHGLLIAGDEFDYGGTEIEESFIVNPNIRQGNATDPKTYPVKPWIACTSPAYPPGS